MPGGDRTGPIGAGPMTGRGRGACAGFSSPGYGNPGFGGGGRGWRHRFWATGVPGWAAGATPPMAPPALREQRTALEDQVKTLESQLQTLKERLKGMEDSTD